MSNPQSAKGTKQRSSKPQTNCVGIVGLGAMGATIASCLLAGGATVVSLSPLPAERRSAKARIRRYLRLRENAGDLAASSDELLGRLKVSSSYTAFAACDLVIESVVENLEIKREVISALEKCVDSRAVIASNTSTISMTALQEGTLHPERILGMHWLSSSPFGRCVEVMPGEATAPEAIQRAAKAVEKWDMLPVIVQCDAPGFVCNRIYYAMLREAFYMWENGIATPADIDRALRGSIGTFLPYAGLFGYLDLNGLNIYPAAMANLFPHLSAQVDVPAKLQELVQKGALGTKSGQGVYEYSAEQTRKREREFENFRRDLAALMKQYRVR